MKFSDFFSRARIRRYAEIDPDEVLLDASNIPKYDKNSLEGRLEKPISKASLYSIVGALTIVFIIFLAQAWKLQIADGETYLTRSNMNLLRPVPIFAARGTITDRNGVLLAWNAPSGNGGGDSSASGTQAVSAMDDYVPKREYATTTGLAHIQGYVQYPSKDNNGFYYTEDFQGIDGAEKYFNSELQGINGSRLIEVDAHNKIVSQNIVKSPVSGQNVALSVDSRVQSELFNNIKAIADQYGFKGGAGIIMNTRTGEIIALTSYPEYNPQVMSDKTDKSAVIAELNNPDLPFLDRAVDGLYTPGSIVKPYIALGVLNEGVIDPNKIIVTTGSISVPNPYNPSQVSVFNDWKDLGPLDLRHAIAMSSDAYFYTVGGGYKDQNGLGIANIDKYLRLFGFGSVIPDSFVSGKSGTIPTPEWKKATFNEPWYLGDTYHTAIGQYGTQVTPAQIVRAVAAVANGGTLLVPTIIKGDGPHVDRVIDSIPQNDFQIVREGMRLSATIGTGKAMNVPYEEFATKTGTAELGASKEKVNSWITGFWPYQSPKYAFAVMLEQGSVHNLIGAAAVMRRTADWMEIHTPEYFNVSP
ncbi:hypothetical protein KGQ27_01105 [Patescibacteria group bacterium]|nr:hypothetical protein [Patescibacteria group bacterium]MDE1946556.1 hypothetical protein [Patescibacteria group bacterium]MDE2010883.1 hypothetical protein [Patescibacteria group bacterium]MDE2232767.1 hypothetical protein [Patescibacteria group bacterium]